MLMQLLSSLTSKPSSSLSQSPVVIGGTGGSGTRLLQPMVEAADYYMGDRFNLPKDNIDFVPFLEKPMVKILQYTKTLSYEITSLPKTLSDPAIKEFKQILKIITKNAPHKQYNWGWKIPNIVYALPFVEYFYPEFRFMHVVRDGRDIAFSKNQNQLRLYYSILFDEPISDPFHYSSIRLWNKVNQEVADFWKNRLGERYLLVRFEDLYLSPKDEIRKILKWLKITPDNLVEEFASWIKPLPTLGRWKQQDLKIVQELEVIASQSLSYFKYCN